MRKNVFTGSIKILIFTMLILSVFFQKELSQKLTALALILWAAVMFGIFLFRKSGKLAKKCAAFSAPSKQADRMEITAAEKTAKTDAASELETESAVPASPSKPAIDSGETEVMLLHIALRITEKLKSAYPQSLWQWKDTPSLQDILAGGTVRILVENMDAYTHADISFDRFGRIHVEPMTIGSFAEPSGNNTKAKTDSVEAAEETFPEPSVVDARVWYELVGQKVLEAQITELNANGHTKLTIKENGDIVITSQKKERLKGTLESFPAKSYWEELILLLAEDELKGKITGNTLQVSWI